MYGTTSLKMSFEITPPLKENKSCNSVNVCEFCGRSFASISELELHVKIHTHEKPFECMVCFMAFATRSAMRIHEKIHTGEEQHVCHHCHLTCVSRYVDYFCSKPSAFSECKDLKQPQLIFESSTFHFSLPLRRKNKLSARTWRLENVLHIITIF